MSKGVATLSPSHCCAANRQFDLRQAEADLRGFLRHGPSPVTRQLLAAIQRHPLPAAPTLLDIGGGVGIIHHTLLERGFASATEVDASEAGLKVAAEEAARRGHQQRVTFRHADFRSVASVTPPADVVTLDRVVCCDPDYAGLLNAAADHARVLLAFTFPHNRWYTRLFMAAVNAARRLRRRPFRSYVHSPNGMKWVLEEKGLRRCWSGGNWIWRAELFERAASTMHTVTSAG